MTAAVAAPVAVGAVGGSGTRVYARILEELGLYIGPWLNGALDNLVFSGLLKDPARTALMPPAELASRVATFRRLMEGSRLGLSDLARVVAVVAAEGRSGLAGRLRTVLVGRPAGGRWGWKEPNTQLFLEPLAEGIDELRYLHVLRHGLDMALSSNRNQLRNFGWRFGLQEPDDPARAPEVQLDYWVASSRAALADAQRVLPGRHLISRFDDLCEHPREELARVVSFLGVTPSPALVEHLATLVEVPRSRGRHRDADLSWLRPDQADAVAALGFAVDPGYCSNQISVGETEPGNPTANP